jgi:hypothetical protein
MVKIMPFSSSARSGRAAGPLEIAAICTAPSGRRQ